LGVIFTDFWVGRCHRIGQGKRVDVIIPTIADTIDADIQKLLDNKQTIIEEVLAARLGAVMPDRQNEPGHRPALSLAKPLALN